MRVLLSAGADTRLCSVARVVQDRRHRAPPSSDVFKLLCRNGMDPADGASALSDVVHEGVKTEPTVRLLIALGADVSLADVDYASLDAHRAKLLLAAGAPVDEDWEGELAKKLPTKQRQHKIRPFPRNDEGESDGVFK